MIDDLNTLFVCATKRSGSTYIGRWIGQQPDLPNVREWFQAFEINDRRRAYGLPENVPLETLVKQIRAEEKNGDWFGIKIMWDNFVGILDKRTDPRFASATRKELVEAYFPNAKFVWLTRENKMAQAVSLAKALQTGVWEVRPTGPKPVPRDHTLRYSFLGLEEQRQIVAEEERQWADFFDEIGVEPTIISYEDFKENPPKYISQIRRTMGLDPHAEAVPPQAEKVVAKTHDSTNQTWLERHAEDKALAAGTSDNASGLILPRITSLKALIPEKQVPEPELNWECNVSIENRNSVAYPRMTGPVSKFWPRITAIWREISSGTISHTDIQELPHDVPPGETSETAIILIAPPKPGHYELTLEISQPAPAEASRSGNFSTALHCTFPAPLDALHRLLGDFVNYHGEWICSPWFGFIYVPEYPWIYHDLHGWLECPKKNTDSPSDELCFNDVGLGSWTTTRQSYPMIHHQETGKTLKFLHVVEDQRIFVDEDGNETKAVKTIASD